MTVRTLMAVLIVVAAERYVTVTDPHQALTLMGDWVFATMTAVL